MRRLLQGLFAGLLAGLLAAFLFVVDYGPGNSLHGIARWPGLDSPGAGRYVGFFLMLLIGALFGLLFGLLTARWRPALGRWLLAGLATGLVWWILFALVIGAGINHLRLDFGGTLFYGVPLLVYGLLLGSISFQMASSSTRAELATRVVRSPRRSFASLRMTWWRPDR